jgi:ribosome maturation factor RimP
VRGQQHRGTGAAAALEPVVAAAVAGAGFDLEQLHVQQAGRRRLVKVVIDVAAGDGGVNLDEIAEVSRRVSAVLDEHDDKLGGPYTLEVTSPGLDRPLTKPRHWRRAKLRLVQVRQADGAQFTGRVGAADDDPDGGVEMLVNGAMRRVAYADVAHAVIEVEFGQPPAEEMAMLDTKEESR